MISFRKLKKGLLMLLILLLVILVGNRRMISYFTERLGVKYFKESYIQEALKEQREKEPIACLGAVVSENGGKLEQEQAHRLASSIYSEHAILIDLQTKATLFDKASEEKTYPASITKVMTTIVAIEHLPDLQTPIVLEESIFEPLVEMGASMAGFYPGETVEAIDLLYGVMLPSGADAAVGLADYIAGSEENFVALMNEKAAALGMNHTHFTNVTGLHDPDHYTTVSDLAILLEYALENQTFEEIFRTETYEATTANCHREGLTFKSTMFDELGDLQPEKGMIIGGKTGYTNEAGLCLASMAQKANKYYLLITTSAGGSHSTLPYNVVDALTLYNIFL